MIKTSSKDIVRVEGDKQEEPIRQVSYPKVNDRQKGYIKNGEYPCSGSIAKREMEFLYGIRNSK